MEWLGRLKKAASAAAAKVADGADQAARYVAQHGPGAVGESAAELVAERDYLRARQVADGAVQPGQADAILPLLLPHWGVAGNRIVQINRLIADSYLAKGDHTPALEHYRAALEQLRDPLVRRGVSPLLVEDEGRVPEEVELNLLLSIASVALAADRPDECLRAALEALTNDARCATAIYLQGAALLRKGLPSEAVVELFLKALELVGPETVLQWVEELMPAERPRLAWLTER